MFVRVNNVTVNQQQLTVCTPHDLTKKRREVIIYYHGIGGEGIDELPLAYQLVQQGYEVILPDAYLHSNHDRVKREDQNLRFFDIIDTTSQRLKMIYQWLENEYKQPPVVYVGGTSMGGIITAISLKKYPFINKAAILMGTAKLVDFYHYIAAELKKGDFPLTEAEERQLLSHIQSLDLSQDLAAINNRDVFIWHGESDQYVPFYLTDQFVDELSKNLAYRGNITYVKEPNQGHKVSRLARKSCVEFFNQS